MNGISSQFDLLGKAIRFTEQNHRVISQNLANVNTPHYKTKELSFEQLVKEIEDPTAPPDPNFAAHDVENLAERNDGNNVDLDREITDLKKNSLAYQTLVQILGSKIGIMNRAING